MFHLLGSAYGTAFDTAGVPHDSPDASQIAQQVGGQSVSFASGSPIFLPTATYRFGDFARGPGAEIPGEIPDGLILGFQDRVGVVLELAGQHAKVKPIVNMHGVGTEPYTGPHPGIVTTGRYHEFMLDDLVRRALPPGQKIPLLYELIPTLEEAQILRDLLIDREMEAMISLYICEDDQGVLCIQKIDGTKIPLKEAFDQINRRESSQISYGFNCFDPRLLGKLLAELRDADFAHKIRIIYPNASDAASGDFTPVGSEEIPSQLISWARGGVDRIIGGCCGFDPDFIAILARSL